MQRICAEIAAALEQLPLADAAHLLLWVSGWQHSDMHISYDARAEIYRALLEFPRPPEFAQATWRRLGGDREWFVRTAASTLETRRQLAQDLFRPLAVTYSSLMVDLVLETMEPLSPPPFYRVVSERAGCIDPSKLDPWRDTNLHTAIFLAHLPAENCKQILQRMSASLAGDLSARMASRGEIWESKALCLYAFVHRASHLIALSAVSFREGMRLTYEPIQPVDPPPWHRVLKEEKHLPGWHLVVEALTPVTPTLKFTHGVN